MAGILVLLFAAAIFLHGCNQASDPGRYEERPPIRAVETPTAEQALRAQKSLVENILRKIDDISAQIPAQLVFYDEVIRGINYASLQQIRIAATTADETMEALEVFIEQVHQAQTTIAADQRFCHRFPHACAEFKQRAAAFKQKTAALKRKHAVFKKKAAAKI